MTHGTLPWRGAGERRTIFYKYSPHASSWAATYYDPDRYPGLTVRQIWTNQKLRTDLFSDSSDEEAADRLGRLAAADSL